MDTGRSSGTLITGEPEIVEDRLPSGAFLTSLTDFGHHLWQRDATEAILQLAWSEIRQLLDCQLIWIYRPGAIAQETTGALLDVFPSDPDNPLSVTEVLASGLLPFLPAEPGKALIIDDTRNGDPVTRIPQQAGMPGSLIAIPWHSGDGFRGFLGIGASLAGSLQLPEPGLVNYLYLLTSLLITRLDGQQRQKNTELLGKTQNMILEQVARGAPLEQILENLCLEIEACSAAGALCSVMLLDPDGKSLKVAAAPSIPMHVREALNGMPVAEFSGSCGTAASRREQVIVDNIPASALWADYRDFAIDNDLFACWSTPFLSHTGALLGTFAISHPTPCRPAPEDLEHMRAACALASIAVERDQDDMRMERLSRAIEQSPNIVVLLDTEWRIQYVNPKFIEITGYSADEISGHYLHLLKSEQMPERVCAEMKQALEQGHDWQGEYQTRKKNGEDYWTRTTISALRNRQGEITHYLSSQEDITESRRLSNQLAYEASHDMLTGLINRREFEVRLQQAIRSARKEHCRHAVAFMDLDQFKIINDTCGHVAGDELLRQLAHIIQNKVRHSDTLARLGGDEFGILMTYCEPAQALRAAHDIRTAIEDYRFNWEDNVYAIGVSIGLVPVTDTSASLQQVMRQADASCYAAKDAGRNRVHVFEADDTTLAQRHGEMQWASRINKALDDDRFVLYVQEILPLGRTRPRDHGLYGEILVRMRLDDGHLIPPGAFLPAAERYDLSSRVDRWVLEHTLEWLRQQRGQLDRLVCLSINLSANSLMDETLLGDIQSWLMDPEIPAQKICFEITETAAIGNLSIATNFIHSLKKKGCQFALDDFGSGVSSFAYLKTLPVDILKIDGQFVRDMLDDPIDLAMVKSINDIAHVMGKKTIAEYVENDAIMQQLEEIGIDYGQGFGIGHPMQLDRFPDRWGGQ